MQIRLAIAILYEVCFAQTLYLHSFLKDIMMHLSQSG